MTVKAKKEFLRRYKTLRREEKTIREEIATLSLSTMSAGAKVGDGMPRTHEPKGLEEYAAKLDLLERRLKAILWDCINQQILIEIAVNGLENATERVIMRQRYILFKGWDDIAEFTGYSRRQTLYLHGAALGHLEIPERSLDENH